MSFIERLRKSVELPPTLSPEVVQAMPNAYEHILGILQEHGFTEKFRIPNPSTGADTLYTFSYVALMGPATSFHVSLDTIEDLGDTTSRLTINSQYDTREHTHHQSVPDFDINESQNSKYIAFFKFDDKNNLKHLKSKEMKEFLDEVATTEVDDIETYQRWRGIERSDHGKQGVIRGWNNRFNPYFEANQPQE